MRGSYFAVVLAVLSAGLGGARVTTFRSALHRTHVQRCSRERSVCSAAAMPVMMKAPGQVLEPAMHWWHDTLEEFEKRALDLSDSPVCHEGNARLAEEHAAADATTCGSNGKIECNGAAPDV